MSRAWETLSIRELAEAVRAGAVSAEVVTAHFLERITRFDGDLHGYNHVDAQGAMDAARALDKALADGLVPGPLCGVPLSIKDIADVAGLPATGASASRQGRIAERDAPAVVRLRGAGAIILGKANCHELAFGGPSYDLPFPPASNPWKAGHFPGGSSSGSGVTVGAGLCLGSLATDTAGSIRLPATMCGVFGLKPTRGAVPLEGVADLAPSMDNAGPIAATVEDCAILFAVMSGEPVPRPATPKALGKLSIGVPAGRWGIVDRLDGDVAAAWETALAAVSAAGGTVVELDLPPLPDIHAAATVVMMHEVAGVHAADVRACFDRYGEIFRGRVLVGEAIREDDLALALRLRAQMSGVLEAALGSVDAMLLPGALAPAGMLGAVNKYYFMKDPIPNIVANFTGHPSLAFPAGLSAAGLPIGLQLMGAMGRDRAIMDVAASLVGAHPVWTPRPAEYFSAQHEPRRDHI
ncbi:amidase [Pelagibacterium lacus]|uniref:Indoleacetamide hydrolase n=1 Tax=Pelagibacterium lacus TaxID=2282655 RepID=A0A369W2W1_9HYPH|nr:amidase [Pelagibacterium lacus]RDE08878.1 amidase [Pelagibacterium lacus]